MARELDPRDAEVAETIMGWQRWKFPDGRVELFEPSAEQMSKPTEAQTFNWPDWKLEADKWRRWVEDGDLQGADTIPDEPLINTRNVLDLLVEVARLRDIDAMWRYLKAQCCVDPANATRIVMLSEESFRQAMDRFHNARCVTPEGENGC